jgi:hypothetical protein
MQSLSVFDFCPELVDMISTWRTIGRRGKVFEGLGALSSINLFEDVFMDAYYSCRLLTEGGVLAFDDCSDPHVAKVIRFLQRNCREGLRELDLEPYRTGIGQSLRYRSARLLGRVQMRAFPCIGKVERVWNAPFHNF